MVAQSINKSAKFSPAIGRPPGSNTLLWSGVGLLMLCLTFTSFRDNRSLQPFRITGLAQGTSYSITYYHQRELVHQREIDSIFNRLDQSLSIYSPTSLISRFNQSATGIEVDIHLRKVTERSLEIFNDTDGAFDITVYPLVKKWGFGIEKVALLPNSATIRSILPCVGSGKIRLVQSQLVKAVPCTQIDVNGIAQGYSVDVVAAYLERKGIRNYLVEVGGELRVKGRKYPENKVMSIGIQTPTENDFESGDIQRVIEIDQGGITTSGNYRKYRQIGSRRLSHIIDPKTGFTTQSEIISVTVLAKDALTADGYDNALLAMGLPKALSFLKRHPSLNAYIIYQKQDGSVGDTATAGFYKSNR
ncbi:FAD:protein FMN transferase [Spirosoma sp. RP8]|uniref:FAD:protein FMN transferase n=1 Tax=Spirosoma liriopis TaxID=2937440 RepID=A0ABT0HTU7_9BACT|nr:FAD:protein FMN transferase [Spirosoma liriopis]MCK8494930.1 FAD:protein FMN transferase [Spirosoma liriopis]